MTEGRAAPLTREQWLAECCKLAKVYEDNMTKALDEIERKALALVNEVEGGNWLPHETDRIRNFATICHAIEQHEAFRQEMSDAVRIYRGWLSGSSVSRSHTQALKQLDGFIIPEPVDPLEEILGGLEMVEGLAADAATALRAALAARGLKVVEDK